MHMEQREIEALSSASKTTLPSDGMMLWYFPSCSWRLMFLEFVEAFHEIFSEFSTHSAMDAAREGSETEVELVQRFSTSPVHSDVRGARKKRHSNGVSIWKP